MAGRSLHRLLMRTIVRTDPVHQRRWLVIEALGSALVRRHDPAGAVFLARYWRQSGFSKRDPLLNSMAASANLRARYLPRLVAMRSRHGYDHVYLGMEYLHGNPLSRDLTRARAHLRLACALDARTGGSLARRDLAIATLVDERLSENARLCRLNGRLLRSCREAVHVRRIFQLSSSAPGASGDAQVEELLSAWAHHVDSVVGRTWLNRRVEAWLRAYVADHLAGTEPSPAQWWLLSQVVSASPTLRNDHDPYVFARRAEQGGHQRARDFFSGALEKEMIDRLIKD